MHILLIHQAYMGGNEAGGTRHSELGSYLVANNHTFSVIASTISYLTGKPPEQSDKLDQTGIQLVRAYTYSALHRSYLHRAISFISFMISSFFQGLKIDHVDLVWGTSPPLFQAFPAWLLAKIKRVPFVLEIRDLWPAFAVDMGVLKNPVLIQMAEWAERFLYRNADHLIVNSPAYKDHLVEKGADRSKVSFISNGVDLKYFQPNQEKGKFTSEYGLEDKFIILYAGAHGPANDLETVLEASLLLSDQPEIRIVLVGDGKSKSDLIAKKQEMGLTNLIFIPPMPKSRMGEVLAGADICLATLKDIPMFKMTYPNKVFDYMAAGKPTLLAIDGVIRKVIEDSRSGIFIPPGDPKALADAVLKLRNDPEYCQEMGRNARSYVEQHFNRKEHALQLENLFRDIILMD